MSEPQELPFQVFHEFYEGTFREIVYPALLAVFNQDIRDNYIVTGIAQMPDGKWVVRLERNTLAKLMEPG
jgi:hypothetical protein